MSKLYLEIFNKSRLAILAKFEKFNTRLVLGGGSALCLQLGHRKSYDFDIFLTNPLTPQFFQQVIQVLGKNLEKLVDTQDQLCIVLEEKVEITFLHYYWPPLFPLIPTQFISLYDPKDIGCDKARTLGRRNVWRDYVDLYFLLKGQFLTLESLWKLSEKKFGPEFALKLFLEQLTYFGDIKEYTIEYVGPPINSKEIKEFLRNEVKQFKRRTLGLRG